jgi:hypothetical protein
VQDISVIADAWGRPAHFVEVQWIKDKKNVARSGQATRISEDPNQLTNFNLIGTSTADAPLYNGDCDQLIQRDFLTRGFALENDSCCPSAPRKHDQHQQLQVLVKR